MNYEITVSELVVNRILILLGYYRKSAVVFKESRINPRVYSLRGCEEAREEAAGVSALGMEVNFFCLKKNGTDSPTP